MILPENFCERMKDILGDEYPAFAQALTDGQASKGLFCARKMSARKLQEHPELALSGIPFTKNGFLFEAEHIGRHPLHHAGAFYVQDPSAQATVSAVEIKPGAKVLDCCAAPGGKTVALSAAVGDEGFVLSNEIDSSRAKKLAQNVERMGLRNTLVTSLTTEELSERYREYFDIVLADAPCSGEGMFRKYETAQSGWNPGMVKKCADLQKKILDNVAFTLAPGGILIYSTCTFSPEEDEWQTEAFLCRHPEFSLIKPSDALDPYTRPGITEKTRDARRFYPHIYPGEGQYIAVMRKSEGQADTRLPASFAQPPTREELTVISDFLKEYTTLDPAALSFVRSPDGLRALSCAHPYPQSGAVSYGVLFGSVEKGIFRPHHNLFSAYGEFFKNRLDLPCPSPEIDAYLKGNTLNVPNMPNGWCCVLAHGCPLGGGKVVSGTLKNHYPKGLRNL